MFRIVNTSGNRLPRAVRWRKPRGGSIVAELILAFPVLLILVLAVVEFGLILAAVEQVAFASRQGAKVAAEESPGTLDSLNTSAGGSRLRERIDQALATGGLPTGACRVVLQHDVGGAPVTQVDDAPNSSCDCEAPTMNLPGTGEFVRVTVCVPLEGNVPNLLATFGFSLQGRSLTQSTTWRYEH